MLLDGGCRSPSETLRNREKLHTDLCLACVSAVWTGSSTASYTPVGAQQNGRAHQQAALHHPSHHCELRWCLWTPSLCCWTLTLLFSFRVPASRLSVFLTVCVHSSRFEAFSLCCEHASVQTSKLSVSNIKEKKCNNPAETPGTQKNDNPTEMELLNGLLCYTASRGCSLTSNCVLVSVVFNSYFRGRTGVLVLYLLL